MHTCKIGEIPSCLQIARRVKLKTDKALVIWNLSNHNLVQDDTVIDHPLHPLPPIKPDYQQYNPVMFNYPTG